MDLLVREARLDDAEAIVRILNSIIETGLYTALDTPFTVEAERQFIANLPERGVFHVAGRREDAKILGFQTIEPYYSTCTPAFDHVALMGTFVELLQRRQGIGTGLSQATFEAARRKGYEKTFTYLRADNLSAVAFCLQLGFRIVGTAQKQARFGARYVDEIIIETFLWRSRVGMVGSKDCDGLWRPACESLDRVLRRPVSSLVIHQRPSV